MVMENLKANTKNGHPQMNYSEKGLQGTPESGFPSEEETGINSPIIEDFDEELCMELEEVGKELDLYKAESLRVPDLGGGDCPFVMLKKPSALPLECLPHGTTEACQPTSMCPVEPRRTEAVRVSVEVCPVAPVSTINHQDREGNEEREYQLKALNSLKASLVGKLKMRVTHKANLTLQKDSLLKNFDGDKIKLSENLQKNLSQCKEVDAHIQSLNSQVITTRNKIITLKSKKLLPKIKNHKKQSDVPDKNLLQTQSKPPKDSPVMTDEVCENNKSSLLLNTLKTVKEKGKRVATGRSSGAQNGYQTNVRHSIAVSTVSPMLPHPYPEQCNTTKPAELNETKKKECKVVEKLASKLAMHPSSKNLNTLWCKTCNLFFTSIIGYIRHLEVPQHFNKEEEGEHCLHKLLGHPIKTHEEDEDNTQEALGVEFLHSTKLMYCSLCECPLITRKEATSHCQSVQHNKKYKEYILRNTSKELAFQKAKMVAFTEYYKRRKTTLKDKEQKTEGKVDENKSKVEGGVKRTEPLKTKTPNEKEKEAWAQSENSSTDLQGKAKEGRKFIKESPLMPQKINVNIKTENSVVGGSIKRTSESPAVNKRRKMLN